ncbi:hypothetical protein D3C72_1589180 [compost metagenome]
MLSGASTSMVGNSGRRSQAMAIRHSATMPSASHLPRSGSSIFTPVDSNKPAAAAARPANTCCTCASFWKRA